MNNNILLHHLPEAVEVSGIMYPISWGYRSMILIEICMFDASRSEEQRVLDALNIFYLKNIPADMETAMDRLLWFYRCGRAEKHGGKKRGASERQVRRCYCFRQDAPYIYAAYKTQYQIDLNDTKNYDLHWWKFYAMFESLDEDLKISKIMYYRTASVSGLGNEKRKFLNEMKKLYALEEPGQNLDDKMKLSKRNADMKAYVRRRAADAHTES